MMDRRIGDLTPEERTFLFDRPATEEIREPVRRILDEVRTEGDAPLFRMARAFDGVELEALEVPRRLWNVDVPTRDALERAARNLEAFHRAQMPGEVVFETEPGVRLGRRSTPLPAVGVYAPGGTAAYPSSVLMGVVPARAAGVPEVVVCSPPGPDGLPPAEVRAACRIGGATRLFALGGAGAVAAMAYGTESVPRVEAIVGPGNQWVTEAKRQVAGALRIDAPAGPSELLVVAGPGADPDLVVLEMVAQAEHDREAAVAVVGWDDALLTTIRDRLLAFEGPRAEIVHEALTRRGAIVRTDSREEALAFAEDFAAEHLSLMTDDPRRDLETQTTAGTVFLGASASVAFGDYMTGANHVLPTAGRSRAFSGLSTLDFLRFYTWQEITPEAASSMAEDTARLADAEGLPGHASAARARQ